MLLTYSLSDRNGLPIYEYLYRCIRNDILSGRLTAGERMPSKRLLAAHLKISVVTVETAYAQLIAEGYLDSFEKRGYFVAEGIVSANPSPLPAALSEQAAQGTSRSVGAASSPASSTSGTPSDSAAPCLLDLTANEIASDQFPFSVWSRLMRNVISEQHTRLLERIPAMGVYELRKAIADYLYELRGMTVEPEQILIGAGTEYLYQLLIQLLGRDSVYAMENPGYRKAQQIYEAHCVRYRPVKMDEQGISMRLLRQTDANIVHISPAHHYPTGTVMSIGRRRELLAWAAKQPGRYILEDEYDSEFRFAGKPIPPLFSVDPQGCVVYMNTFSKCISPSIRISYLILPKPLLARFEETLSFYSCTVPSFEQYTLARFIGDGYLIKHINRTKNQYRLVRDELIALMEKSPLASRITIREEDAGLHFLMQLRTEASDREVQAQAERLGIRLQPLSDFLFSPENGYEHTFVVNYSSLSREGIKKAGELLLPLLEKMSGTV